MVSQLQFTFLLIVQIEQLRMFAKKTTAHVVICDEIISQCNRELCFETGMHTHEGLKILFLVQTELINVKNSHTYPATFTTKCLRLSLLEKYSLGVRCMNNSREGQFFFLHRTVTHMVNW